MSSSMLPRIWRTISLFLLVAALLFLLAPYPSNILAQTESDVVPPDEAAADTSNPGMTAYAEALGISYEEAERRLLLQAAMNDVESKIAQQELSYAGSWTQHEPEFRLVVALADPDAEAIVAKYLEGVEWADLVTVVQRPNTLAELEEKLMQVQTATEGLDQRAELIYATGLNIQEGKVRLYSPTPDALQGKLAQEQVLDGTPVTFENIEFVLQEQPAAPAQWKYPYVVGGTPITTCTAGYVVKRHSDDRRFMSTAGHCSNTQNALYNFPASNTGIYLGNVILDNNPLGPTGPRGREADFQTHNTSVRDFDLTNRIRTGSSTHGRVISYQFKASTVDDWVCKHGKSTGYTCGFVWDIAYNVSE